MTYVIGHKNPDTDAIVSAIVNANIRNHYGDNAKAIKLGPLNKEAEFVLNYWNVETPETMTEIPEGSEVVLVDHNERSQAIDNIENMEVISIIDHHKFNLVTNAPLHIIAQPVGSTATILGDLMLSADIVPTKQEAGLLISAIISDTLFFRSATTTETDSRIMNELNEIAQIEDLETYSLQMFNAKSDLGDMPIEQLIKLDYKEYELEGKKVSIGVLETTSTEYGLNRKDEIVKAIKKIKEQDNIDHLIFSIINIIEETNTTIVSDPEDEELVTKAFKSESKDKLINLGNLLSRKKQITPTIENYLKNK